MQATAEEHQFTDAEFQAEIIELTHTQCLPWLKEWCELNRISRSSWSELYQDVLYMMSITENRKIQQEENCCVSREMVRTETSSKVTCELLGWIIIRSRDENSFGSHEIYDGNILLDIIVEYGGGYSIASERNTLHGGIYTAALEILPKQILENKVNIRRLENALAI